jgi:toxin ParE1/3/4
LRVFWSGAARSDLSAFRAFIGQEQPEAARRQAEIMLAAAAGLARFPESGRPGRVPGTRELLVGRTPWPVVYRWRAGAIEVLRVLHGRQRWPAP